MINEHECIQHSLKIKEEFRCSKATRAIMKGWLPMEYKLNKPELNQLIIKVN